MLAIVSLVGTLLFSILRNSYSETHNIFWKIYLISSLQFDFYGAIIPAVSGLFLMMIYFVYFRVSKRKFFSCFLLTYAFAILFFQPQIGTHSIAIVGVPYRFSFVVGFIAVIASFLTKEKPQGQTGEARIRLRITKINYIKGLMIASSFGFLSVLLVDLTYFSVIGTIYAGTMYVGALGLADGILLSGLYALPIFTFQASLIAFSLKTYKLLGIMKHQMQAHFGESSQKEKINKVPVRKAYSSTGECGFKSQRPMQRKLSPKHD
jgi:hypothetical protein